jgi:hypothetical protein
MTNSAERRKPFPSEEALLKLFYLARDENWFESLEQARRAIAT